jgi:hypothetical protein
MDSQGWRRRLKKGDEIHPNIGRESRGSRIHLPSSETVRGFIEPAKNVPFCPHPRIFAVQPVRPHPQTL